MTLEELLALVAQDSNDYDEEVNGWLCVSAKDGVLTVEVQHQMGGRSLARWSLTSLGPVEEER
jgi:hypothetical protein